MKEIIISLFLATIISCASTQTKGQYQANVVLNHITESCIAYENGGENVIGCINLEKAKFAANCVLVVEMEKAGLKPRGISKTKRAVLLETCKSFLSRM